MQITGIILAGGKSKRFGMDKALAEWQGKTLLEHAIDLCTSTCDQLIISSNQKEHGKFGIQVIPDVIKNCGPMGGIYSCLQASSTKWNFVLSVDSPMVGHDFVRYLLSGMGEYDAVIPVHQKGIEPLIALYNQSAIPKVEQSIKQQKLKMQDLIKNLNVCFLESGSWIEKRPDLFKNLNRPGDLD